jgi:hypothetical protein
LKLREETIEELDELTYLDSITTKNNTTKDVEKRMNKARSSFGRFEQEIGVQIYYREKQN